MNHHGSIYAYNIIFIYTCISLLSWGWRCELFNSNGRTPQAPHFWQRVLKGFTIQTSTTLTPFQWMISLYHVLLLIMRLNVFQLHAHTESGSSGCKNMITIKWWFTKCVQTWLDKVVWCLSWRWIIATSACHVGFTVCHYEQLCLAGTTATCCFGLFQVILFMINNLVNRIDTVDGRNPAPPGMYKTL